MLLDAPLRQFHTSDVDWDPQGCSPHTFSSAVSDVTRSESSQDYFNMDYFIQPLYQITPCSHSGNITHTLVTATPPAATGVVNNVSATATSSNMLYYIVQHNTKVPQLQTQPVNTFLIPDHIMGTLNVLNQNILSNSTQNVTEITENIGLQVVPTQAILISDSMEGKQNNNDYTKTNKGLSSCCERDTNNAASTQQHAAESMENPSTTARSKDDKKTDRMLCNICFKKYEKRLLFDTHYHNEHPGMEVVYMCSICRHQDKDFNHFRNHFYKHFKKGHLRCSLCPDYYFTQSTHYEDHSKNFHPENNEDLFKKTNKWNESVKNQESADLEIIFEKLSSLCCFLCKQKFTEKTAYDYHYKNDHLCFSVFYECALCHRNFIKFKNFTIHSCVPVSSPQKSLICDTPSNIIQEISIQEDCSDIENKLHKTGRNILLHSEPGHMEDPIMSNNTKENFDLEMCLNDRNMSFAVDENQNSSDTPNRNGDIMCDEIFEQCDLFENIRCPSNLFLNYLSESTTDSSNKILQEEKCELNANRLTSMAKEKILQNSVTNLEDPPSTGVDRDIFTSLIDDNLFELNVDFIDQDLNVLNDTCLKTNFSSVETKLRSDSLLSQDSTNTVTKVNENIVANIIDLTNSKRNSLKKMKDKADTAKILLTKEACLVCYYCKKECQDKDILSKHINREHPSWCVVYECRCCRINEYDFEKYKNHSCHVFLSRKGSKKCIFCKKDFKSSKDLVSHINSIHKEENRSELGLFGFLCKICKKKFPIKSLYDSHYKKIHSKKIVYNCSWCNKKYTKYESYRSHRYGHIMSGRFTCQSCGLAFAKQCRLSAHEKAVHGDKFSTITTFSVRSTISSCSTHSSMTSISSPDNGSSLLDIDTDVTSVDLQSERMDCCTEWNWLTDTPTSASVRDGASALSYNSDVDDSANMTLSPTKMHSSNHDSSPTGFEEDTLQRYCDVEREYINSPESGIDCANSPFSDLQSIIDYDYYNSPEKSVYGSKLRNEDLQIQRSSFRTTNQYPLTFINKELYGKHENMSSLEMGKCDHQNIKRFKLNSQVQVKSKKKNEHVNELEISDYLDYGTNETKSYKQHTKRQNTMNDGSYDELNRKNKVYKPGKEAVHKVNDRSNTKPLSEDKMDNCIQSVINTSEDFKPSVICHEYIKGIKYNDIVRCNNDKSGGMESPSQQHSHNKQQTTPNIVQQTICFVDRNSKPCHGTNTDSSNIHKSADSQFDNKKIWSNKKRQCCFKEQCENCNVHHLTKDRLDICEWKNTGILLSPLSSLRNNCNVIKCNNSTGDLTKVTRNDEDFYIVVNNDEKTEDIQSRHIIIEQSKETPNNCTTDAYNPDQTTPSVHQLSNLPLVYVVNNATQTDNMSNNLDIQKTVNNHAITKTQCDYRLNSVETTEKQTGGFVPLESIPVPNSNSNNVAYKAIEQNDHQNIGKQTIANSPIVFNINLFISTSNNGSNITDNVTVIGKSNNPDNSYKYVTNCTKQDVTSLPLEVSRDDDGDTFSCHFKSNELLLTDGNMNKNNYNALREFRRKPKQTFQGQMRDVN